MDDRLIKEDSDELEWDNYVCSVSGCGETAEYEGWVHTYRTDGTLSPIDRVASVCAIYAHLLIGWKDKD